MKVRIGIDVGGTFTDAVAIDNDTYEIVAMEKIPTTHSAEAGVAEGIIQVVRQLLEKNNIDSKDVVFISHGTTQATNALLEGDVAKVGILTLGTGLEGEKSKQDTHMDRIMLTDKKQLPTCNAFADTKSKEFSNTIEAALKELIDKGCQAIVVAEAFSVDNPTNENYAQEIVKNNGVVCTATNEISQLYGLKIRTRTTVLNASIMPKMLSAANMTSESIEKAGIESKLMIMRCDGGVMTIDEVRKRPILTVLSGPAAGVAGALMYEKLTDGLFFEVGGTSTDISCVKDGRVMVKYSQIGGHKTFLTSLDVRTVGIGGGSMIQIVNGKIVSTGPRSAHIAGLEYEVYTSENEIVDPVLKSICPAENDPEYAYIECSNGRKFALTLSGAANIAGFVKEGDYAHGNIEAAKKAWKPIADSMNITVEEAAMVALNFAAEKNSKVAKELMKDYGMDPRTTVFVGGGGGASTAIPHLAKVMGHQTRNAKNAPVISTIGVALAMVRDMVERNISNPTEEDILAIKREAELQAIKSGAAADTVEVQVEVDTQRNLVRATAIGSTELRTKNLADKILSEQQIKDIVADKMQVNVDQVQISESSDYMYIVTHEEIESRFLGFFKRKSLSLCLVDNEGVVRLHKRNASFSAADYESWQRVLMAMVERHSDYNEGGKQYPSTYVVFGKRIINLSGLAKDDQILGMAKSELAGISKGEKILIICSKK